jgi:hypothetical protein
MAHLLVQKGADPTITDAIYHSSPLGWAEHFELPKMADLLRQATGSA